MLANVAIYSMLVMAVLVGLGGVMGFVKAKSKASLISGIISAALLLVAFFVGLGHGSSGMLMGAVVNAILCAVFGVRLKKTGKFMPAGLMLILCIVDLVILVAAFRAA